jgi:hypothetical protein
MVKKMGMMAWMLVFVISFSPAMGMAERVPEQLIRKMAYDNLNVRECLDKVGLAELSKHLDARRVSLRKGGGSEYIVEATSNPDGCGLCGNRRCDKWIYRQDQGFYRLLLNVGGADDVVILARITRGYRDLKVIYPAGNNYPAFYEIYTFNGSKYKRKGKPIDIR